MPLNPARAVTGIDAFGDIPVKVEVRIGCWLPLQETAKLFSQAGTISLKKPAGDKLDLFAGDLLIAAGEVMAVENRLAIRIADLYLSSESAPVAERVSEARDGLSQHFAAEGAPLDLPESVAGLSLHINVIPGSASLPLQEIFHWTPGSIIKLDQTATRPADVVVNGRVLARGQIMLVDGNYGLRVLPK
jgi:flagellar motor switch/type III secretory pathway protein FliN